MGGRGEQWAWVSEAGDLGGLFPGLGACRFSNADDAERAGADF